MPEIRVVTSGGAIVGATVSRVDGSGSRIFTDSDGTFDYSLLGGGGPIAVDGGIEKSTGLAFVGYLSAPASYSVISPISSLVQALVDSGDSLTSAETSIRESLGLSISHLSKFNSAAEFALETNGAFEFYVAEVLVKTVVPRLQHCTTMRPSVSYIALRSRLIFKSLLVYQLSARSSAARKHGR